MQILFLTIVEAGLIFKFVRFPLSFLVFFGVLALEAVVLGYYFSPHRSPTLKEEYLKISPLFDAVTKAQKKIGESLNNKGEAQSALNEFNSKLSDYEAAFPHPDKDLQDPTCRKWVQISLVKFKAYSRVAEFAVKENPPSATDAEGSQLLQEMKAADSALSLQLRLVVTRYKALEKSYFHSILVGLATWLHTATSIRNP